MRIEASRSQALVIDIQERLFPHIYEHDALAARSAMLIRGLRVLDIPVHVTEQYSKGLGPTIPVIADALGGFEPIEKMTFSACGSPDVEARVLGLGRHAVIVFGIETHVCVQQTVLDLLAQGQTAIVVEDCVSSRRQQDRDAALRRMASAGAIITTAESLLFEFMRTAEHPQFKQISQLVK